MTARSVSDGAVAVPDATADGSDGAGLRMTATALASSRPGLTMAELSSPDRRSEGGGEVVRGSGGDGETELRRRGELPSRNGMAEPRRRT